MEEAFEKIAPALLQTRSIREPRERVQGFNYSHMKAYEHHDGDIPDYLQTQYGLPAMDAINVQKMIRGNIDFVDSKLLDGVQAVDLLASGLRKLLRGEFSDNSGVAQAIGRLTMQNRLGLNPISLTAFSEVEGIATPHVAKVIRTISASSKRMLLHDTTSDT